MAEIQLSEDVAAFAVVEDAPTVKKRPKFIGLYAPHEVVDAKSFASYAQQRLGIPYPTRKSIAVLNKALKEFFAQYPQADYGTMCRLVEWAIAKRKRFAHTYSLVYAFRYAYKDGYLPELDPNRERTNDDLEALIEAALVVEKDPEWRRRLMVAHGVKARSEVYEAWRNG